MRDKIDNYKQKLIEYEHNSIIKGYPKTEQIKAVDSSDDIKQRVNEFKKIEHNKSIIHSYFKDDIKNSKIDTETLKKYHYSLYASEDKFLSIYDNISINSINQLSFDNIYILIKEHGKKFDADNKNKIRVIKKKQNFMTAFICLTLFANHNIIKNILSYKKVKGIFIKKLILFSGFTTLLIPLTYKYNKVSKDLYSELLFYNRDIIHDIICKNKEEKEKTVLL